MTQIIAAFRNRWARAMDRVRNYISFITWFVGLSYLALWPLAVPCAGVTMESWRDTCQSHSALVLSPGLHVIGAAAAGWAVLRLGLFGLRRLLRIVSPKAERFHSRRLG